MMRVLSLLVVLTCCAAFGQRDFRSLMNGEGQSLQFPPVAQNNLVQGEIAFDADGTKSIGLAFLYSLILPGMGELYVGDYGAGKYFTLGEGILWLTYGSMERYGTWLRDDARSFAVAHADIGVDGKDDQFFVDIGNFGSMDEYNQQRLRDREVGRLYNISSSSWTWDADANRALYRDLRISHDRVFNNTRFVVAAIIVNHLVSAVNAARLAVSYNKGLEASMVPFRASVIGGLEYPQGIMITFSKAF